MAHVHFFGRSLGCREHSDGSRVVIRLLRNIEAEVARGIEYKMPTWRLLGRPKSLQFSTMFFCQLFIGLSAVCSAFRLFFSPKLVHKVNNCFRFQLICMAVM
jgi:hypothetical protein